MQVLVDHKQKKLIFILTKNFTYKNSLKKCNFQLPTY